MVLVRNVVVGMLLLCAVVPSWAVAAEDEGDLKTTIEAMKQRLRDQDRRIAELETHQATSQPTTEQIKQVVREMKADTKEGLGMPTWWDGVKLIGDFRLRYHGDYYDFRNANGTPKADRNRARFRLRVGLTKTWLDGQLETTFRLASGDSNDPTTTNQTLTGDYSKKIVWIDLAYAKYAPKAIKGLAIIGGKMITPWVTNDIFFDTDVNPEGFWAEYKAPKIADFVEPFVGSGFFILNENSTAGDATAGIFQGGVKMEAIKNIKYTVAGIYQDYARYDTTATGNSNVVFARGNDYPLNLIPRFRVAGVSNNLEFPVFNKPLVLIGDWAHNCGENDPMHQYSGQNNAYCAGLNYGVNKKKGDWSLKYRYAYIEADSMPGYFTDSDFGYANRKGHVFGGMYNIMDNLTIGPTLYFTQPIFAPTTTTATTVPLNGNPNEKLTTTLFVDLVWKF
ncbi:MAG: putative porin [Phycisphaerae bacterium]|jgi:hypothetical protein